MANPLPEKGKPDDEKPVWGQLPIVNYNEKAALRYALDIALNEPTSNRNEKISEALRVLRLRLENIV